MKKAVSHVNKLLSRASISSQQVILNPSVLYTRGYADVDASSLKKTALYDYHVENGGKMVPFAGWSMPIQYKDSIMDSTLNCRSNGSLFDVSHMCGLSLKGKDAIPFFEKLVVGDISALAPGTGSLSCFTNDKGGIIDDTVITKVKDDHIYIVVNAGCRDKDLAHIESHLKLFQAKGGDVKWHIHDERSLLALQVRDLLFFFAFCFLLSVFFMLRFLLHPSFFCCIFFFNVGNSLLEKLLATFFVEYLNLCLVLFLSFYYISS